MTSGLVVLEGAPSRRSEVSPPWLTSGLPHSVSVAQYLGLKWPGQLCPSVCGAINEQEERANLQIQFACESTVATRQLLTVSQRSYKFAPQSSLENAPNIVSQGRGKAG